MDHQSPRDAEAEAGGDAADEDRAGVSVDRGDAYVGIVVMLAALVVYVLTLAPGLLKADSGEFQTLAVTLGYAHPTGYPVYLLIAKLATFFPIGEMAYRVNLLSAVMGAAAAGLVYLLGRLLTGRRWSSVVGAAALAVSPTFWSQAIIAEVYTFGVVCTLGVLLGLESWRQTGRVRWLFQAACLGGISLGVHSTVALLAPAAVLIVALTPRRWKANWAAAVSGAMTGLGVMLAAYAVIDRADSPTSYFRTVICPSRSVWNLQPNDLDGFLDRVKLSLSAPQFQDLLTSQPAEVTRQKTIDYGINLAREFPPFWLAAAAVGLFWLGRRNWKMTMVLVLTGAIHLCYDLQFDGVVHVLYIATYVPIAVFGTAGLAAAGDGSRDLATRFSRRRLPLPACDLVVTLVGLGIVGWPMLWADAWNVEGRRECWVLPGEDPFRVGYSAKYHDRVRGLIDDLEPDAVVFTGWCHLYPYYHVAYLEKGRTEMVFIQDYPHPNHFELADSALEYVKEVSPRRPVYFSGLVTKVAKTFEMKEVRRGSETLYRVGRPLKQ